MSEPERAKLRDDPSIEDSHALIRHASLALCRPVKRKDGSLRVPSNAFHLRQKIGEVYLSIDLEALLLRDGLSPTHHLTDGESAARLPPGAVRQQQLGVTPEPRLPENPHHGGIWGLGRLTRNDRDRVQNALAKQSVVLFRPAQGPP